MFDSLEIFIGQEIDFDDIRAKLVSFKYTRVKKVLQEGEFRIQGEILDIFPDNFETPVRIGFDETQVNLIANYDLLSGEILNRHRTVIILPHYTKDSALQAFNIDTPLNSFVDISSGDYVVHNNHGIGKYLGVEDVKIGNEVKEHLIIEYGDGDKLFVPKHDLRLVQKYVAFHKKPPRLYKLGSKEWQKTKAGIQKKLQRMAAELLHMQAMRASLEGHAFARNKEWEDQFDEKFPYDCTPDQKKAIQEVSKDMESLSPMDRLICGDVGYGKTEVALRAAFKSVMDGKQVAVLVPTTLLAEQHYFNFKKRFSDFPVTVQMLSRFRTAKEQKRIVEDLKQGEVDIIIGTHRLLSKDISFKDLGLIVIDEEQRFGVKAKERLKHFRLLADVLTMTATPIPRTLHMSLTGAKDMSPITTPPGQRQGIETEIIEFDEEVIQKAIRFELDRKGQVFFLHNRVEDIERIGTIVEKLVPDACVAIGHGQMSGRMLEDVMVRFLQGEIDVLVCTTIIESGIDIPNANTLIVNRADRLGLSDLHQLRGRVGRSDRTAFAYLIIPPRKTLSKEARARIEAIEKYSGLGAGFQIAMEDLQIRGAGNLLGQEQSGYITSIGFDLYCRLLKQSIEYLKQKGGGSHDSKKS